MGVLRVLAVLMAATTLCAACASIAFYDNEEMTGREVGLRVYTMRPYVMVSRTKAKDAPLRIEVVSLPDLANPRFVRVRPGIIGNSKLSLALSNGAITNIGMDSDSGVAGLLTAYGGLTSALAGAEKTREEAATIAAEREDRASLLSDDPIDDEVVELIGLIRTDIQHVLSTSGLPLLPREARRLTETSSSLQTIVNTRPSPSETRESLTEQISLWRRDVRAPNAVSGEDEKPTFEELQVILDALGAIASSLAPDRPPPDFTLYEIDTLNGRTVFREVTDPSTWTLAEVRLELERGRGQRAD